MTHSFPLEILKELSSRRNDQATRQLGQTNRRFQDEQNKLAQLNTFRQDYQSRYEKASQQGQSGDMLINFRNFLERLDEAVRQQQGVLEQMRQQVCLSQGKVRQTHRQMQSMDVLAERHGAQEQQRQQRQEQKNTDEQVGQKVTRSIQAVE